MPKPPLQQGIRQRYAQYLLKPGTYVALQSFGIGRRRAKVIALQQQPPSLREALVIDCVTNGECDVYSWVDTEWMEQRSNADCEGEVNALWQMWPRPVLQEHRRQLRLHMVQRLGAPDRNVLAIVQKLGYEEIAKDARKELASKITQLPVIVDEDATDEQIKRAFERHERRRARISSFIKGKRSGY